MTGITSLVESSTVGALVDTLAALVKRRLNGKLMRVVLVQTLSVSCMFMWIIMAALCFSSVFDGLGAVHAIKTLFLGCWHLSPWGVQCTITCQIAYMTPPFGYNLFLMKARALKGVTLGDIYSSIIPVVILMLIGLVLVMVFPDIAMFLARVLL